MKMKRILSFLLASAMVFAMAGCTTQEAPKEEPTKTPTEQEIASSVLPEKSEEEKETAELEETLVIYSTHPEDLLDVIAKAFEEKTGVKVESINLKGELADRVRSEKENPQADIMFGGDSATYTLLKSEGLFAPTSPEWKDQLNPMYKDAEGYWYGTIKTPVMLFYNSEILTAEEAPKDWADLTKEEYKDKIVVRDSLSSSMRSTICNLIDNTTTAQSEEAAWEYLKALDSNIKNYYNSGSMMYSALGKGEAAISWAVLSDIISNKENNQMPFEIIDAQSGSVVLTDCIAAINNAPHPNAAAAFVEFAGSSEVQAMVANQFNRVPTLDAALSSCPEWMQAEYKAMEVNWDNISANQSQWLEQWETNVIDANKNLGKE